MFIINSVKHHIWKIADYLEFRAIINEDNHCSINSLRATLAAPEDEIYIEGTEEGDDKVLNRLQESIISCSARKTAYSIYPFNISHNSLDFSFSTPLDYIYVFLLFANRLDMQQEKVQGGKDATELFEKLCRVVAQNYLGNHAKCVVFGTSVPGSFEDKVKDILQKLHIHGDFKKPLGWTGHQKDGGIDIVAWIPFKDDRDSQLIALGQCKTGTNWETKLRKKEFFKDFSTEQPFMDPIYLFFVCEDFGINKWEDYSRECGILFSRRRIIELIPESFQEIERALYDDIKLWVDSAMTYLKDYKLKFRI